MNYKLCISAVLLVLVFSHAGYSQWVEQTNPSNKKLHSVYFLNTLTGYVCGDTGTVMISVNSGALWTNINSGIPANINMTDVQFLNTTTGYCSGGLGSLSGKVYKTINGGVSWNIVFDTTNSAIRDIFFIDNNTGWAAANTTVKYTSNGGTSWVTRGFNGSSNMRVLALSPDTVFVAGFGSAGYMAKSVNGGINWSFASVPSNLADLRFIFFTNSFTGYSGGLALGGLGGMCKTTDRGLTWVQLNSYTGTTPTDCSFINDNTGYVVNSTELKLTTDGGASWNNQAIPSGGQFEKIALVSSFGCIAGKKIATISTVGIHQISNEMPEKFSLEQNYPNPFNPTTNIRFNISSFGLVTLKLYNITGSEISVLINEELSPGTYNIDIDAAKLATGVYFYRLETKSFSETRKMTLVK